MRWFSLYDMYVYFDFVLALSSIFIFLQSENVEMQAPYNSVGYKKAGPPGYEEVSAVDHMFTKKNT